jgi:hypothetical protein
MIKIVDPLVNSVYISAEYAIIRRCSDVGFHKTKPSLVDYRVDSRWARVQSQGSFPFNYGYLCLRAENRCTNRRTQMVGEGLCLNRFQGDKPVGSLFGSDRQLCVCNKHEGEEGPRARLKRRPSYTLPNKE